MPEPTAGKPSVGPGEESTPKAPPTAGDTPDPARPTPAPETGTGPDKAEATSPKETPPPTPETSSPPTGKQVSDATKTAQGADGPSETPPKPDTAKPVTPETTQKPGAGKPAADGTSERVPGASDKEHAIDEVLRGEGREVKPNPLEGKPGAGRQGDRIIDGVKTEYKSLDQGAGSNTIRNTVNESIKGGAQARSIIIDARGSGLTKEQAMQGVRRAMGISRGKIDSVRVIGDGWSVTN